MRQANPKVFSYSQRIDKKTNPILTLVEMDRFKDKIKELLGQSQQFASIGQQEGARKAWDLAKVLSKKYLDHFPYSYAWGLARGLYQDAKGNIRGGKVQRNPKLNEKKKIKGKWQGQSIDIKPEDSKLLMAKGITTTNSLEKVSNKVTELHGLGSFSYAEFIRALGLNLQWALDLVIAILTPINKATVASAIPPATTVSTNVATTTATTPVVSSTATTPVVSSFRKFRKLPPPPSSSVVTTKKYDRRFRKLPPTPLKVASVVSPTTITSPTPLVSSTSFTRVFNGGALLDLSEQDFFSKCEFFMAQEHIFPWEAAEFPVGVWKKEYMEKVAGATQVEVENLKRLFTQISPAFSTLEGKVKGLLAKPIKKLSILDKDFLNTHVKLVNKIKKELMTGNMTLK
jgi:hypothetical protein